MSAYTDADERAVIEALLDAHLSGGHAAKRVLDAVAPAIAARALREAAHNPAARLSGHSGVSVRWLEHRADEIERT